MQKKSKPEQRLSTRLFSAAWIAWTAIVWGIVGTFAVRNAFLDLPMWAQVLIIFGGSGIALSHIQNLLLKFWQGTVVKHWVPASNLAWIIGSSLIYALMQSRMNSEQAGQLVFGAIFAIPAIVQAYLLRNHLKQTWLWALTGLVSGILLVLPMLAFGLEDGDFLWFGLALGGALIGLVQTLVLDRMQYSDQVLEKQKHEKQKVSDSTPTADRLTTPDERLLNYEVSSSDAYQQERR